MGCLCSKVQEPQGFKNNDLIASPAGNAVDIMVSPVQNFRASVFEKQIATTPLLKDVNFAPVDSDSSPDSIDDEEIENLLNENDAEEKEDDSQDKIVSDNGPITFEKVKDNEEEKEE